MDTQQLRQLKPKLRKFLSQFDDCFLRKDTRSHLPTYVEGQLSSLQDKSVEPIALKAEWPHGPCRSSSASSSGTRVSCAIGCRTSCDRTRRSACHRDLRRDPLRQEKGQDAGVKRQWCGAVGKEGTAW